MKYEIFEDRVVPGQWRVEGFNSKTAESSIVVFAGTEALQRARQYFIFITEEK